MASSARRRFAVALIVAISFCLFISGAHSQTETLRRVTVTPDEATNLNPTLSGDGGRVVFESSADLAATGSSNSFHVVAADASAATFKELSPTRGPAPAVAQAGTRVAFAGSGDPVGENRDGNPEIFFHDGAHLRQLTKTTPDDSTQRASQGCFAPSISDDGRLVAFASNRDLTGANADRNSEIYILDTQTDSVTQITSSAGDTGARDPKLSGDGSRVAFVRDNTTNDATTLSDLLIYSTASRETSVVVKSVAALRLTYGRAASDDGLRFVYSALDAKGAAQVFLLDGRNGFVVRQITQLGARATDVPPNATISGDGSRIAFATRRSVTGGNSDSSVELYTYDITSARFTRVTDAPAAATAEVVSSLNDDGSLVAFNFPRALVEPNVAPELANNSEIFVAALAPRAQSDASLQVFNAAVPNKKPASVASDSIAILTGKNLALTPSFAERRADGSFPSSFQNVTVNVGGRKAEIFYVSPTQINLRIPAGLAGANADVSVFNHDGFEIRGSIPLTLSAPGVFTANTNGTGEAIALDNLTLAPGPFDATDERGEPRRLIIFCTGLRNATNVEATVAGRAVKVEAVIPSPDLPGLDQLHVALPSSLKGAGAATLVVRADGVESNKTTLTVADGGASPRPARIEITPASATIPVGGEMKFNVKAFDSLGDEIEGADPSLSSSDTGVAVVNNGTTAVGVSTGHAAIKASAGDVSAVAQLSVVPRTLVINEVLADPPDGAAGDANHDGTRSGSDDEFVELVNGSGAALDLSGWTLRTRALNSASESVRHTFAQNGTLPAGEALVLFGGGNFNPDDPVFGGAIVGKASTGSLSLTNAGLTILVRDAAGNLVTQFSYGVGDGFGGDSVNQSITRSPDIEGAFARHADANPARRFSPGVRVDGSFFLERAGRLTRATLTPTQQQTVFVGDTTQFVARAFDQFDRQMKGVAFNFESGDGNVAVVDSTSVDATTGAVTFNVRAVGEGTAQLRATATDGQAQVSADLVELTVKVRPPKIARVEVTPSSNTLNRGATTQLSATAFDENDRPVPGVNFTWSSDAAAVATVDASGLASAVGVGTTDINATASDDRGGTVSNHSTLTARVPLVINELLADVPPDNPSTTEVEGDANRDGVRNPDDDEFVELVNNTSEPVDISGVQIADATTNRFTFPAHTTLEAGRAVVVFGGGSPDADDPVFGGALILKTVSLGLNDAGDTVTVKLTLSDKSVAVVDSLAYGAGTSTPAPKDQSLTRAPDAEAGSTGGGFAAHTSVATAAGRAFSPGTRNDGTPFGSPALTRIEVTPNPSTLDLGEHQDFTARAFAQSGGGEAELPRVSFIWSSSDTKKSTLSPSTGMLTTATALASGAVTIRARAGNIEGTATLSINPTSTPSPSPTPNPSPTPSPSPTPEPTPKPLVVIGQVYGGGGNSGSVYKNDFVELFNRGGAPVDLSGWSVQYASAGGSSWQATNLSGVLLPSQYYLVQEAQGAGGTTNLPTPDATGSINLSATAGKVALVNTTTALTGNGCPFGATVVDFVGFGSEQDCFEGAGAAHAPSNTNAILRAGNGCDDSDDNSSDFAAAAPDPRNSASPFNSCSASPTPTPTPSPTPTPTQTPTPSPSPTPSPTPAMTPTPTPSPTATPTPTLTPTPTPTPGPTPFTSVVISQLYGGGGNSGATYRNDFVELFNRGDTAVDLSGWSVQYASFTGSAWQVTKLTNVTIRPGQYYLVQEAKGSGGTTDLPTPDATGTIAMSVSAGKVALVNSTAQLSGACPAGASIVDLIGYGGGTNCFETAVAPAPSNTTADIRAADGCTDTNNNSTDFSTGAPNRRNTASPVHACGGASQATNASQGWPTVIENVVELAARESRAGKIEAGARPSFSGWPPPLNVSLERFGAFSPDDVSALRRTADSKRWRTVASASGPRDRRGGPPRPRGASP